MAIVAMLTGGLSGRLVASCFGFVPFLSGLLKKRHYGQARYGSIVLAVYVVVLRVVVTDNDNEK